MLIFLLFCVTVAISESKWVSPLEALLEHAGANRDPSMSNQGVRHILLVTSHPDDEAMFFSPLLTAVKVHNDYIRNKVYDTKPVSAISTDYTDKVYEPVIISVLCLSIGEVISSYRADNSIPALNRSNSRGSAAAHVEAPLTDLSSFSNSSSISTEILLNKKSNTMPSYKGTRVFELYSSLHYTWNINFNRILIINNKYLIDSQKYKWNKIIIANIIIHNILYNKNLNGYGSNQPYCRSTTCDINYVPNVDTVVTFDDIGVSNHSNHKDTYLGVKHAMSYYNSDDSSHDDKHVMLDINIENEYIESELKLSKELKEHLQNSKTHIQTYMLKSQSLTISGTLKKYCGPLYYAIEYINRLISLSTQQSDNNNDITQENPSRTISILNPKPILTWIAMSYHESQWVPLRYIYRKFHVLCSQYSYVNYYECLDCDQ